MCIDFQDFFQVEQKYLIVVFEKYNYLTKFWTVEIGELLIIYFYFYLFELIIII